MRLALLAVLVTSSTAAFADVTVFMDRDGGRGDPAEPAVPAFGGSDAVWKQTVACVGDRFAPFRARVTDARPKTGAYITVLVGGKASLLGMSDETTDGVGPWTGDVIPDATVHVFSQVTGEDAVGEMCSTAAHEVGHALGLDHSRTCGDLMSYWGDACGPEAFVDVAAPCGEFTDRACGSPDEPSTVAATQNSFRWIADHVGLKPGAKAPAGPAKAAPVLTPDGDGGYTYTDDSGDEVTVADGDTANSTPADDDASATGDAPDDDAGPAEDDCADDCAE